MSDSNIIQISGETNTTIYGKGDTCLLLNPFDTYHLFRVYNNWTDDSNVPFNLSNSKQKIYLLFKGKKSEIKINEYENTLSSYKVDKSNGELLFKITKEEVNNIFALNSDIFYIIRTFEERDSSGNLLYTSGEEVLFIGKWADESKWTSTSLSSTIKSLNAQLNDANSQIIYLSSELEKMTQDRDNLSEQVDTLSSTIDSLNLELDELREKVSNYESATEFSSVVVSDNATYSVTYNNGKTEDGVDI